MFFVLERCLLLCSSIIQNYPMGKIEAKISNKSPYPPQTLYQQLYYCHWFTCLYCSQSVINFLKSPILSGLRPPELYCFCVCLSQFQALRSSGAYLEGLRLLPSINAFISSYRAFHRSSCVITLYLLEHQTIRPA